MYHRIEKYWLKELQLKKPSFARAVWKAENSTMIVIIVMSMIAATMNFISLTFIGLLIDWFGDNEVLGSRRTPLPNCIYTPV